MATLELKGYSTVREVSEAIGVTPGRVRQILQEIKRVTGKELGILVGTTRLLEPSDVKKIQKLHAEKRLYGKSSE